MKRLITNFLLLTIALMAIAAEPTFSISAPHRVAQGDKFVITYRLKNASGSSLKVAHPDGCTLLYGPSVSTSHSTQIINGQVSTSMASDYTYCYRADRTGEIRVGEASISAEGKTLRSNSATITVVASAAGSQGGGRQQNPGHQPVDIFDADTQQSDRAVTSSDVFVRIILSRPAVFEQEAVVCEIKLYTKYGISSFAPTLQPSFNNFLIEELDVSNQMNIEEVYNGQQYMTATLKKCILYPQTTGKLKITSGNYDLTVIQYDRINMGLFNYQQPRERQIKISSNEATLTVNPLPEPRPAGFNGAVGDFTAESHLVGKDFKSGDPASLIFTVKGTGNIKYLKEPEFDFPTQFEVYTPTSNVNAAVSGNNMTGTMTVDYTFVPQTSGDFTIAASDFVYFNPSTGRYVTVNLPSYPMKVAKGTNNFSVTEQSDIDNEVKDIRYIDLSAPRSIGKSRGFAADQWWFWLIPVVCTAILAATVIATRRRIRLNADIVGRRHQKASKVARRRLNRARAAMEAGNSDLFHDELLQAIWGYLSDKLAIPVSSLSRANISETLLDKGYDRTTVDDTIALIDECETAKYAPAASNEQIGQTYSKCCDIIDRIERTKNL